MEFGYEVKKTFSLKPKTKGIESILEVKATYDWNLKQESLIFM